MGEFSPGAKGGEEAGGNVFIRNSVACIMHRICKQKCGVIRPQEQGSQRYENSHEPRSSFFFFPSKFKKSGVLGELERYGS